MGSLLLTKRNNLNKLTFKQMDLDRYLHPTQGHTSTSRATLRPFYNDTQTSKINELKYPYYELKHPYQKGMFISISSHKLFYDKLISNFKRQYQSVLKAIGIKVGRDDIKQVRDLPSEVKINELIKKKVPILIGAIHDNPTRDGDGIRYQHSHLFIYNIHHYLPSNNCGLNELVKRIRAYQGRFVGSKYIKDDGVDVRPVGTYQHYEEDITDDDFYNYLLHPINNPRKETLINYMKNNRKNPDVNYSMTYLYYNKDYMPIDLTNRTLTTEYK